MTTSDIVQKRPVTDGLIAFLAAIPAFAAAGVRVGDADAPGTNPDEPAVFPPFVEVRRLPDGRDPQGGWAEYHSVEFAKFQVIYVGDDRRVAEEMADVGKAHFIAAAASGQGYEHEIPVTGHAVIGREVVHDLGYVPSGRAFGCMHHYRVLVQRT